MTFQKVAETQRSPGKDRVPWWIVGVSACALVATTLIAFAGANSVGVTWDERVQIYMLQRFFDEGWHTAADIINGAPDPNFYFGTYVYGPVGELLPHLVNVVLGRETLWGQIPVDAASYAGRHMGIALWGLLGVAAAGLAVTLMTRSRRWGIVGAAVTASVPLWTGHSMFNIKDTPTATGYTLLTLGLVALVDSRYFRTRWIRITGLVAIALGLVLAIGTRTALALPLTLTLPLTVLVMWLLALRDGRDQVRRVRPWRRLLEGLGAYVAAYLLLVLIYPKAFLNPIEVGAKALLDSALYPVNEAQLVNGEWMVQPVSWLYQPLWFAAQLPLLVLVGLLGFLAWWLVTLVRRLAHRGTDVPWALISPIPVLLQLSMVPLAAIVGHATLYNGVRQMLFVVPAAAILATAALARLVSWRPVATRRPLYVPAWILIACGLVAPVVAQVQLFPYGYAYVNGLAALQPVDGRWPTDYWRASGREMLRSTPEGGYVSCGFEQLQKGDLFPCEEQPMFEPFLSERGIDTGPIALEPGQYWFIRGNHGVLDMPPGCSLTSTINRPLLWQTVTIAQIAICDEAVDTGKRNMADPSLPAE